jgi:hypothetical protein
MNSRESEKVQKGHFCSDQGLLTFCLADFVRVNFGYLVPSFSRRETHVRTLLYCRISVIGW